MSHPDGRSTPNTYDAFAELAAEPYLSLTTFRRDGTAVPTTVWCAPSEDRLLVWTGAQSGKVKRLRHAPVATVAPCDQGGSLLGDPAPAHVRIMGTDEKRMLNAALTAKYGWQFRISVLGATIGRLIGVGRRGQIGLEITLD